MRVPPYLYIAAITFVFINNGCSSQGETITIKVFVQRLVLGGGMWGDV